ncbi:hypothetical protein Taro_016169, partial [Colocasia esculenta]|nr:hypothetical protein [Colocasia esculenta]
LQVLFGLEFAHVVNTIKTEILKKVAESDGSVPVPIVAEVTCSYINPSKVHQSEKDQHGSEDHTVRRKYMKPETDQINKLESDGFYNLGGLTWHLPASHKMEQYLLFWIGCDNPAFANVILMFNGCETVRYDASENCLVEDVNHHKRVLKRRYYLVERAKDANIVGIVVGTLAVAGYLHIVQQMKQLIEEAGKKSYTLLMGRPNPAKLANFPECDVFIYVSCAQTALLDSKEFLAPVITPFEAMLAFQRGSRWTGEYVIEFSNLMSSFKVEDQKGKEEEEARFSFFQGGYVEDVRLKAVNGEEQERSIVLAEATQALSLKQEDAHAILFKGKAQSAAEFFSARSYRGLEMQYDNSLPQSVVIGRTGRAAGYTDEK